MIQTEIEIADIYPALLERIYFRALMNLSLAVNQTQVLIFPALVNNVLIYKLKWTPKSGQ